MALFGFGKKQVEDTPLQPPKPPAGVAPIPPLSSLDQKIPKVSAPAPSPPNKTATVQSLPPLPPITSKPVTEAPKPPATPLPPLAEIKPAPMPEAKPAPALPPLPTATPNVPPPPTFAPAAKPAMPPLPVMKPAPAANPPLPPLPAAKPANPTLPPLPAMKPSLPPLPSKPVVPPVVRQTTPPAPSSRPSTMSAFDEAQESIMPSKQSPRPLPTLATLPKISVKEETKPKDPFTMPPPPAVKLPEPPKQENSRLAKVLENLNMDDFDLPPLTPMQPTPPPTPQFMPQMGRESPFAPKRGKGFVTLQRFEEVSSEIRGTEQHLHNLQTHNEKLGIIETHTKNELETLVTVFEIMQRQLISMDDKLFTQQGE